MKQHTTHYYNSCQLYYTLLQCMSLGFCKNFICYVVFCVSSDHLFVRSLHYIQPETALRSEHKVIWIWHEWVWSSSAGTHLEVAYDSGQASLYLHQCKPKTWNSNKFWIKYMNWESERIINLYLYSEKIGTKIIFDIHCVQNEK